MLKPAEPPAGTIQTQYSYEPFGQTTQSGTPNQNQHQYTGRENDGTGLYYYRARYYNPRMQRFISEDPIDFLGGQTNLYAYVSNRPITYMDPSGQQLELVVAGGVALGPVGWILLGGAVVTIGIAVYVNTPSGSQVARNVQRALERSAEDGTTAKPVPTTADPSDTSPRKPPEEEPCGPGGKRRLAKEWGKVPRSAQPLRQGRWAPPGAPGGGPTLWWEYLNQLGQVVIIVEHPDGSVHVGIPKPQSGHPTGEGPPKFYKYPGAPDHVGCE